MFIRKKKLREWLIFCASNHDFLRYEGWTKEEYIEECAASSVINYICSKAKIEQITSKDIDELNKNEWK